MNRDDVNAPAGRERTLTRPVLAWSVCAALAGAILVTGPLFGRPALIRLPGVVLPALVIALVAARPWRWTARDRDVIAGWTPTQRTIRVSSLALGAILFWIVLTRFQSGDINAIDFTVYFDRPLYQTAHGRLLFVETADLPAFSHRSQLAVHAYYLLLVLAPLYAIAASPYWLLALSVAAVTFGAIHVFRVTRRLSNAGLVGAAAALAFALNANTARTLLYGFHPEILYAWFIPAALDAALERRRWCFLAAVLAATLVKEDAVLALFALAVTVALIARPSGRERWLYVALPPIVALANLAIYYRYLLPALSGSSTPVYIGFWQNHGPTLPRALWDILSHPVEAVHAVATSGILRVLLPFAFLPLVSWRMIAGILPIVVLYAGSANPQLRAFGIYYSITLVPFLAIAGALGALRISRLLAGESSARIAAASVVVLAALMAYGDRAGYSLRPWRPEVAATRRIVESLASEPVVLVQSALYPHAGYDARVVLLTRETLREPRYTGRAVVLAPHLDAYPLSKAEIEALARQGSQTASGDGIVVVRRP